MQIKINNSKNNNKIASYLMKIGLILDYIPKKWKQNNRKIKNKIKCNLNKKKKRLKIILYI